MNTGYFFACEDEKIRNFLLKNLNSKLIDWYSRTLSVQLGEKAVRMFSIYVLNIPISKNIIVLSNDESEINRKIYELYGLSDKEINYIENL